MKNIELKEINHYYGKEQVLHDVNISIKEGEFFTLLGPSGCGKTLCANIISKCYFSSLHTVTLNMSVYRDINGLSRLINGSSNNYLEFVSPLVKALNNCPNSLIVLDDFDKVTNEIKDFFLDVFDKGFFYDNRGNYINCTNALFILNSNYSETSYNDFKNNLSNSNNQYVDLGRKYGENFLSRITKVIHFNELKENNLKVIMGKYLKEKGLEFETSTIDEAYNLSSRNEYRKSGARLGYKNIKKKIFEREKIRNT